MSGSERVQEKPPEVTPDKPSNTADFGPQLVPSSADRDRERERSTVDKTVSGNTDGTNEKSGDAGNGNSNKTDNSDKAVNPKSDKTNTKSGEGGDRAGDRSDKPQSIFNPGKLLSDFSATVGKDIKAMTANLPSLEIFGGGSKAKDEVSAEAKVTNTAQAAIDQANKIVENKYFQFRDGKTGNEASAEGIKDTAPKEAGNYKNEDGSTYEVNKNGDVSKLTTATGKTFKAEYNDKHEMVKMTGPDGNTFTKVSPTNDKGFAFWQAKDAKGQNQTFGTNSNGPFVGKLEMNNDGTQIMIGHNKNNPAQNTHWAGTLLNNRSDGSDSRTSLITEKGKNAGFETNITQADGSKITTKNRLDETGKVKSANEAIVTTDKGDTRSKVVDGKILESQEKLLSKDKMKEIVAGLNSNERLNNLKRVEMTTTNGVTHVDLQNKQATSQKSIKEGTVINGIMPSHTNMDSHTSFDLTHSKKDGAIEMKNVNGVVGHGSGLGPLKRRWHAGSSEVNEMRFVPGKDGNGSIQSLSSRGWMTAGSHVLNDKARESVSTRSLEKAAAATDFLNQNTKKVVVEKAGDQSLKFNIQGNDKLKQTIKEQGLPIQTGDKISGKISYDNNGIKIENLSGVKALGAEITGLKLEPDKNGEMKATAQMRNPENGETAPFELPKAAAEKLMAAFSQQKEVQAKRK